MGLIKAVAGAASSTLNDGFKDYFYCESLPSDVLMVKGQKRNKQKVLGDDNNIITNGSAIAVADGQAMMIVDQGAIVEFSAEPGEYIYDSSTEPCIYAGGFLNSLAAAWETFKKRFVYGGEPGKDQRVYYFNLKEITGNKYGTQNPVPFTIVDKNAGLELTIGLRCNGEYSYRLTNPILFYKSIAGNVSGEYRKEFLESTLKTELLTALQPALARLSENGIRYSAVPLHTTELCDYLNDLLSPKWRDGRGIEIVMFGMNSVTASKEDEEKLQSMQLAAALSDPAKGAGYVIQGQTQAMKDAANNDAGAAIGFMGMNAAQTAGGMNAQTLYGIAAQNQAQAPAPAAADTWVCPTCGAVCTDNFCPKCGAKKPDTWTCECGSVNDGNFCPKCGKPRQ
ncbi:MAG: SPFH domain-containing protein [Erysipelotrichales bacterium]|nr:SPFH domain-containing protein [Erysipelotrichales bacterium]